MGVSWILILTVIVLCRSTSTQAYSVAECIRACDNTISNDFRQKCNSCTSSSRELTAQMCVKACGNTASDPYRSICSRCTGRPPINYDMCSHACSNTYFSDFRSICDQCVGRVETSEEMCWKACRNTAHDQFRRICSRCPRKYRSDLWIPPGSLPLDKWATSWQNQKKWHVRPAKTQISLGIRPVWSVSSLSAWRKLWPSATHWTQAKTLIRLGGCPGWSESPLGAQSFCWVCHEAAQMRLNGQNKEFIDLRKIICLKKFDLWLFKISIGMYDENLRSMACIACHCWNGMTSQLCCHSNWRGYTLMAW